MKLSVQYMNRQGGWTDAGNVDLSTGLTYQDDLINIVLQCTPANSHIKYKMAFDAIFPTRIRLAGKLDGDQPWHLIPCCIHGDNNLENAKPGQYPNLTEKYPEEKFSSRLWEFRADRTSHPVSMLFTGSGAAGIAIDPYCHNRAGELIRNGVFAELPDRFGVTLGYANLPLTFINKNCSDGTGIARPTCDTSFGAETSGMIFYYPGTGRDAIKTILKTIYEQYRELPVFKKSFKEAAQGLLDAFIEQNWSDKFDHYTNQECRLPTQTELRPWRALLEIAWTGGTVQAYPFLIAEQILQLKDDYFSSRKSGSKLFDEIVAGYNPASGMLFDLCRELNGSRVNGWWDFLKITHDRHNAYINGQAIYYLFMALRHLRENILPISGEWLNVAIDTADTFAELQREDGCCGYAFAIDRRAVTDWNGFAGCWIVTALAAAYQFTGDDKYRRGAEAGLNYYFSDVKAFNCCGAPMDTWKSPDQEGNLAFMKAARLMHEATGEDKYLDMLENAAHYEYLWRYSFKAVPEFPPLKGSNWNSCGGSVTSVSNPHLHPMGLLVTEDLYYLATKTGNSYHSDRAADGAAWAMNCLELFPGVTGYGRYGVTTERYCPSDGLTMCEYTDGRPASMWFSYNGWGAGNMLEAMLWLVKNKIQI